LFQEKRYPNHRSVYFIQKSGTSLLIKIDPPGGRGKYLFFLMLFSGMFLGGCWIFLPVLLQVRMLAEAGAVSFFITVLCTWYVFCLRIILRNLAVVELSIDHGIFRWRYRIWRWNRDVEAPQNDVTLVEPGIKWYGNRLDITMNGKAYSLDSSLDEDVQAVARELRRGLPKAGPSANIPA
jgi:hypothetical protein